MGQHTPGEWEWWTSNSWRRLRSALGHGQTADVCCPYIAKDGHPDLYITREDMDLIVAAPAMLKALKQHLVAQFSSNPADYRLAIEETQHAIAKATGAA